ncbi:hypothetical protein SLNWT_6561 [Streptomyces albus]|uniref:Uncharacterized protein n=1 Tax=Streptomyces albus (strain ATCC 21838 / DSM 41398 / FERM P-419 / JCM 4703 / NBRC 107858) TaxID=1081613 RepID=A0A0B5F8Y3_STRA4|nr:hypothetical protein SLNWT_6561 [Streptomyces albus]AOU81241.1 hypothetical protein SLNHY_6550 [Streptomyces albus]AYN36935.1 hypothetical protein DUI70_6443 [Streptomyces albus]
MCDLRGHHGGGARSASPSVIDLRASPVRPRTPRLSPSVSAETLASALLSRVTSSVRYGCLRDSGEDLLLRRPRSCLGGSPARGRQPSASLPAPLPGASLKWPYSPLCSFVVSTDECAQLLRSVGGARADRHRPAQPHRPQGLRPHRSQDRDRRRGLPRRRHRRTGVGRHTHRPLQPRRLRPAGARRTGRGGAAPPLRPCTRQGRPRLRRRQAPLPRAGTPALPALRA